MLTLGEGNDRGDIDKTNFRCSFNQIARLLLVMRSVTSATPRWYYWLDTGHGDTRRSANGTDCRPASLNAANAESAESADRQTVNLTPVLSGQKRAAVAQ